LSAASPTSNIFAASQSSSLLGRSQLGNNTNPIRFSLLILSRLRIGSVF
jgi:hypothetical protein